MPKISKTAVDALLSRLSDPDTGFNANLLLVAALYGITPYTVDWTPATSVNFMIGQILPDQVEESASFTYPFTTIDSPASIDDARVVSAVFAGAIALVIEVHISSPSDALPRGLTPLAQAIEDAMFASVNNLEMIGVYMSAGLTYNGKWSLSKSSIAFAGTNWRRTLRFTASVGFITD
jgi:hypothetical protein